MASPQWKMKSISMALNEYSNKISRSAKVVPFKLDKNFQMTDKMDPVYVLSQVRKHHLHDLVINCHGAAAQINLGWGMEYEHTAKFRIINNHVKRIFFASCNVADIKISTFVDRVIGRAGSKNRNGRDFCKSVAYFSGAVVYASTVQQPSVSADDGHIRAMKAPVLEFAPGREPVVMGVGWKP